jgi:predicted N-acyltransferase
MSVDLTEISVLLRIQDISASDWDACACPEAETGRAKDIFSTHRFLLALEKSNSIGKGTGWMPQYLVARSMGKVIGVAPLYLKQHSQGEYIFDHSWAHAFEKAGGSYYPKLQISIPFTPASGRRLLTHPDWDLLAQKALLSAATELAENNNLSSLHVTFCTDGEANLGAEMGLLTRKSQQFHWLNNSYQSFEDFLDSLSSRKRKNIRKERKKAHEFGGTIKRLTGAEIKEEHWDAFWTFYQDTGIRKWGTPYLTREFFREIHKYMNVDILLILAEVNGVYIAGALNFIGREALYGRYWGCTEEHPSLHFEICYYQAIEYAISEGLKKVEAGAQGGHKLARGYLPVTINSLHWINNINFRNAVADYLEIEKSAINHENEVLSEFAPYKKS